MLKPHPNADHALCSESSSFNLMYVLSPPHKTNADIERKVRHRIIVDADEFMRSGGPH